MTIRMVSTLIAVVILLSGSFGCSRDEKKQTADLLKEIAGKDGASMVLIPAGEFQMGDHHNVGHTGERPVHTVYLDAFYIDRCEVTNAQYARFLNEYGSHTGTPYTDPYTDSEGHELLGDRRYCLIRRSIDIYKPLPGYEDYPAVQVSWYGAATYSRFYGKRLPTEAEWEKAARGGLTGKKYPWGNRLSRDHANYRGTSFMFWFIKFGRDIWDRTAPVGSFAPNDYGLCDMAGNVYEWCADWYSTEYYAISPKRNPTGPSSGTYRVLRGGTWTYDPAESLRVANRLCALPMSFGHSYHGFRCVQEVSLNQ